MFVELNGINEFVQYHETRETASPEHRDYVIEISQELHSGLQQKKPWKIGFLDKTRIYDIDSIDLFIEIEYVQELSEIDKLKISQAEQFETLLELIGGM